MGVCLAFCPKVPNPKKIDWKVKILMEGTNTMPGKLGGQIRTIECHCGWTCRKQLQEANKLYKLHQRLTHKEVGRKMDEFDDSQGKKGMTITKHGGMVYKPLTVTAVTVFESTPVKN